MATVSDEQHELYALERELAGRLRAADGPARRGLYGVVYDERLERMPDHPLLRVAWSSRSARRALLCSRSVLATAAS